MNFFRLLLIFFLMNSNNGWSQIERILDIPVTIDSRQLKFPLLGGINNPQFSEVDLNNDGQQDLYFFDKIGNVSVTFVGDGNGNYTYTPEYATQFPKMSRIVLLRDYNGDGVQDIFTLDAESGGAGLQVHQGAYSNDTLTFQRLDLCCGFFNVIYYEANSGLINLLVPSTDYPAIEDLDRDGDLDILTFSQSGFTVDYFRNLSVERGFGLDSLHFVKEQDCWGGFAEIGLTTKIDLSDTSGDCANNLVGQEEKISQEKNPKHAGSTISVFDADADGDVEVYLGDISFDNISELTNAGDSAMAWMTAQDNQFPSYNAPVALTVFPASYFVDLDNDGLKDFIAASHSIGGTENYNSVWYYRNVGDADNLLLEFQTKSAFVEETIDLGSGSHPCFVDENADGLMDILVGNFSFFVEAGGRDSRLFLFRNTGSLTEPAFSLVDTNYLDFKQFNPTHYNFTPTFGDIDGDQDLDLIVGSESGSLFFAENEAGVGNPLVFGSIQTSYQSIDVGVGSSPVLADMDNDGLADLIVGERSGNLNYFHNGGSTGSPSFGSSPDDGFFGEVDVRDSNGFGGYSTPTLVRTNQDTFLVVGSESGPIFTFGDIQVATHDEFNAHSTQIVSIGDGWNSHPAMTDLNQDGFLNILVGNQRGGLSLYKTDIPSGNSVSVKELESKETGITIYPNPFTSEVRIENENDIDIEAIHIYTIDGRMVGARRPTNFDNLLDLSFLNSGVYLLKLITREGIFSKRVVKLH